MLPTLAQGCGGGAGGMEVGSGEAPTEDGMPDPGLKDLQALCPLDIRVE